LTGPSTTTRLAAWPFDVRPGQVPANLDQAREGLERARTAGARLLLLPEKWTTSFLPAYDEAVLRASEEALELLHREAAAAGLLVAGSAPGPSGGRRPWNEFHLLGGPALLRPYRKRFLFSPTGEGRQCRPGEDPPRLFPGPAGLERAGAVVCYDLRFPEAVRPLFYAGLELLLVPAQWPVPRAQAFELLVRARALENQCFVLACNRSGRASLGGERVLDFPGTALLAGPAGELRARSREGAFLLAEADPGQLREARRKIPCLRDLRRAFPGLGESRAATGPMG